MILLIKSTDSPSALCTPAQKRKFRDRRGKNIGAGWVAGTALEVQTFRWISIMFLSYRRRLAL